jgi:hypothetical protein
MKSNILVNIQQERFNLKNEVRVRETAAAENNMSATTIFLFKGKFPGKKYPRREKIEISSLPPSMPDFPPACH